MEKKFQNMRELRKVLMVVVCEGEGTEENLSRLVNYFYEEDGTYIGKIDPIDSLKTKE